MHTIKRNCGNITESVKFVMNTKMSLNYLHDFLDIKYCYFTKLNIAKMFINNGLSVSLGNGIVITYCK